MSEKELREKILSLTKEYASIVNSKVQNKNSILGNVS